ncbi:hypothetical protein V2W45_1208824, partial [Cenococcum geophilum]
PTLAAPEYRCVVIKFSEKADTEVLWSLREPHKVIQEKLNDALSKLGNALVNKAQITASKILRSGDVLVFAETLAQADDLRRYGDKWEKILGRSSRVIKPIYGVVAHGVPIRSVINMDKEAVIRKFKLENCRVFGNHRIVKWRWLKPPKEKQRDASLVLEFETAPGANAAIHTEVLCWDSTYKRTKKYNR